VSPVKKLAQGYSYVTDENGHTLTDAEGVKAGDRVKIRLLKGALEAEVTEVLHER
jgi:exodeoxyribonuclease VII large subunit